jgi:hypothetical protein
MIVQGVALCVGALILWAVSHVIVVATGGYGTPHSYVTMATALGVLCAAACIHRAWSAERRGLALFLGCCIVAGELFGLLQTANRLVAASEAHQAPLRDGLAQRDKATKRVEAAKAALNSVPATSERLRLAEATKAAADVAVVDKSSERGCRENCRQLLQAQVDAAAADVEKARAALDAGRARAERELASATTALAGLRAPESPTPFADRIGMSPWALDVAMALLGSLAMNGLGCALVAFGAHRSRVRVEIVDVPEPRATIAPKRRQLTAKQQADRFGNDCLFPGDDGVARSGFRQWLRASAWESGSRTASMASRSEEPQCRLQQTAILHRLCVRD